MRILITSDNHLGYKETDTILSNDSYTTFDEILTIAKGENVDLILLGGDLFHDNRPSRDCLNKTINLLKKYCVGGERSKLKSNGILNSHDKNINISIPVVAIHGNHDDPSGINMISPIDILQSSGLVNYIGKSRQVNKIDVYPLLLEKDYRVAIYGLGYVKDRRLYTTFSEGGVTFHKPEDYRSWYNILVVHQNRAPREKEHLPERFIDDFFDLVIYGHEHESMVVKDRFLVLQPGSTVRTSLCEMESRDKYVYILSINDSPVLEHVKLRTVRPFLLNTMKLDEKKDTEERVRSKIEEMVEEIRKIGLTSKEDINRTVVNVDGRRFRCSTASEETSSSKVVNRRLLYDVKKLLPLIRLRVETNGNVVLNRYRLGAQFKDSVANPTEILSVSRKARKSEGIKLYPRGDKIEISQILRSILKNVEFGVLSKTKFSESLGNFVFKGDKTAFIEMVRMNAKEIANKVDHFSITSGDVEKAIRSFAQEKNGDKEAPNEGNDTSYVENEVETDEMKENEGDASNTEKCGKENSEHDDFKIHKNKDFAFLGQDMGDAEELKKRIKKEDDSSADVSFSFSKYL